MPTGKKLNDAEKQLIFDYTESGFSASEIAIELGISSKTVFRYRAELKKLRECEAQSDAEQQTAAVQVNKTHESDAVTGRKKFFRLKHKGGAGYIRSFCRETGITPEQLNDALGFPKSYLTTVLQFNSKMPIKERELLHHVGVHYQNNETLPARAHIVTVRKLHGLPQFVDDAIPDAIPRVKRPTLWARIKGWLK